MEKLWHHSTICTALQVGNARQGKCELMQRIARVVALKDSDEDDYVGFCPSFLNTVIRAELTLARLVSL